MPVVTLNKPIRKSLQSCQDAMLPDLQFLQPRPPLLQQVLRLRLVFVLLDFLGMVQAVSISTNVPMEVTLVRQCLLLVLILMEATIATVNMDSRITQIPMEMEIYIVWITIDQKTIGVAIKPFQMRDV